MSCVYVRETEGPVDGKVPHHPTPTPPWNGRRGDTSSGGPGPVPVHLCPGGSKGPGPLGGTRTSKGKYRDLGNDVGSVFG